MNRLWVVVVLVIALLLGGIIFVSLKKGKIGVGGHSSPAPVSQAANLLALAKELQEKGNLQEAKVTYQKLINDFPNAPEVMDWQRRVEEINIKLIFSPTVEFHSTFYTVQPADTLTKIAKEFNTTVELIKKINSLADDRIFPGKRLKVCNAKFNIIVYKRQNILILKADDEIIKTYTVATGRNSSTPAGNFKIVNKLINPTWFKAGAVVPSGTPENVLGTRWLGFDIAGYGIHGTNDPQGIGKQITDGCIRMTNPDVEELYSIVSLGTPVTVMD